MMFPVALLLEKKLLPDGGRNSYYPGVSNYDKTTLLFTDFVSVYLTHVTYRSTNFAPFLSSSGDRTADFMWPANFFNLTKVKPLAGCNLL